MQKEYDLLVFIGRMQPPHLGHIQVISEAIAKSRHVLILMGSANRHRSFHNPWTFEERKAMINAVFKDEGLWIRPLDDHAYNDAAWITEVRRKVSEVQNSVAAKKIGLIGHSKDYTSYYLKKFPDLDSVNVDNYRNLSSTDIRNSIFQDIGLEVYGVMGVEDDLHPEVKNILKRNAGMSKEDYYTFTSDLLRVKEINDKWANAPFPPTFHTADAIVEQSGHILLINRGKAPYKGLRAMPGGYINVNEKIIDAAIRELKEETRLKVPEKVLYGSIVKSKVYDDPRRSDRGRIITTAFHIKLEDREEFPRVYGSDDAEKAYWFPIADLKADEFFEDHYFIIKDMLGC